VLINRKILKDREKKYNSLYSQIRVVILCIIITPVLITDISAQISYGGRPVSMNSGVMKEIPVITMPEFNVYSYLRELEQQGDRRLKSLEFARPFPLNVDPSKDGVWENMTDGSKVWRIAIQSRGAYSLNVIFSKFRLEDGVSVFVYNSSATHTLGSFTKNNNQRSGSMAVSPVRGDKIIVEMQTLKGVESYGDLVIGMLSHDFTGILDNKDGRFGLSGDCNLDISCPTGNPWQYEKNGVARIVVNGSRLCTGVLVNNSANDGTPYFLTANHCIKDSTEAANTVFIFGYESPFCNGGDGTVARSLSGSDLRATQVNLDFSLVEIREIPPASWHPWYAGWNRTGDIPVTTASIHHPSGDVKKIAIDADPPETGTFGSNYTPSGHWHIKAWDIGTTEFGSSGSPLYDQEGYLRGMLTGGDASCGDAVDDFYAKFSLAWDNYEGSGAQLKPWLDPGNTGTEILNGLYPYGEIPLGAAFSVSTVEICAGDKVVFTDFSGGNPFSWYWDFGDGAVPPTATTKGPHFVEYMTGGSRTVSLIIEGDDGIFVNELTLDLNVKTEDLPAAQFSYLQNDLEIQFSDESANAVTYYWEFGDSRTSILSNPLNIYSSEGEFTVYQMVRNRACSDTSVQKILVTTTWSEQEQSYRGIMVYPVPAKDFVIIETDMPFSEGTTVELISVTGTNLIKKRVNAGQTRLMIDISKYSSGTYILRIASSGEASTFKIQVMR
jgi:lysyl endopeptidase